MNFLEKIKAFFKSDDLSLNKSLQNIEDQEVKLNDSLTNLLFQESKLKEKRKSIIFELEDIAIELDQAVSENDEEASLYLLEKTDQFKSDISFLDSQLESLQKDITDIQATRNDLSLNKEKYKSLLISQSYKLESLKAKKEIKNQMDSASRITNNTSNPLNALRDSILKTEAELKVIDGNTNPLEDKLKRNKSMRSHIKYKAQFDKLKQSKGALI